MALSLIIENEKGVTFGGAEVSDSGSDWVWNMKVCVGGLAGEIRLCVPCRDIATLPNESRFILTSRRRGRRETHTRHSLLNLCLRSIDSAPRTIDPTFDPDFLVCLPSAQALPLPSPPLHSSTAAAALCPPRSPVICATAIFPSLAPFSAGLTTFGSVAADPHPNTPRRHDDDADNDGSPHRSLKRLPRQSPCHKQRHRYSLHSCITITITPVRRPERLAPTQSQ